MFNSGRVFVYARARVWVSPLSHALSPISKAPTPPFAPKSPPLPCWCDQPVAPLALVALLLLTSKARAGLERDVCLRVRWYAGGRHVHSCQRLGIQIYHAKNIIIVSVDASRNAMYNNMPNPLVMCVLGPSLKGLTGGHCQDT